MQSKEDLERWWSKPDAWGYKTNPDDQVRKKKILEACGGPWFSAIDLGAGEGFITKDLPAEDINGVEISETARSRWPRYITPMSEPCGQYNLVVATGIMYGQYDYQKFTKWILESTHNRAVLCNIKDWEIISDELLEKVVHEEEFPYREYTQHLMILDFGKTTT